MEINEKLYIPHLLKIYEMICYIKIDNIFRGENQC